MINTKSTQAQKFFEKASIYLANRPSIRMRSEIIHDLLGEQNNIDLLDIGCGDGSLSIPFIVSNRIVFLDFSAAMLERVKGSIPESYRNHAILLQANVEDHPFTEKFDVILCVGVLAHVHDVNKVVQKIASLLKPTGCAIFQVSHTGHFYYKLRSWFQSDKKERYGYSLNIVDPEDLLSKVELLGFRCQKRARYPVVFPLLSWLGSSFTFFFLRAVYKNSFFRFLASEHIMLFQKTKT